MAYARNGEFNVLYPTRRKVANVLKKIIFDESIRAILGTPTNFEVITEV